MESNLYFSVRHIKNWAVHLDAFWILHPSATKMGDLSVLYNKDKSKDKKISSRKAWFCILYSHPESDFFNLDHDDKLNDLAGDLFPANANPQKTYESLMGCIAYIKKAVLTGSHKHLVVLLRKIAERDDLFAETPYTLANAELLDKLLKSSPLLLKAIQECEDIIKESAKDGAIKGGGELSLVETGALF